MGSSHTGSLGA